MATSFPKNKIRVLLLENVHQCAVDAFKAQGFDVETAVSLPTQTLIDKIKGTHDQQPLHAIGVRSKTAITKQLLQHAPRLLCVGCFCIGTDNHDLDDAENTGVPIFNAPFSNTRSVAELVIGEIIGLSRQLGERSAELHRGEWNKVSKGCHEVRGKSLGIIGYGHVGSQVSVLAEGLGMTIRYFDIIPRMPMGNAIQCSSIEQVLSASNYVTLHVPQTESTRNLLDASKIALMPEKSYLINASRGDVVDINAFSDAVRSGHLAGGAADVFPEEPKSNGQGLFDSPLRGLKNVFLTPHTGGSTEEAQEAIGREVSAAMIKFINTGITYGAVNFPQLDVLQKPGTHRLLNCHRNVPGVLVKINNALSSVGVNILAQQLSTSDRVGYLIVDISMEASNEAIKVIKQLDETIRTRVLW